MADLKSIEDFSVKASSHKTPAKPPQVNIGLSPFAPHDKSKFLKSMSNLKSDGFGRTSLEHFECTDAQFRNVEKVVDKVIKNMNDSSAEIFTTLRMLEFEKNKIKAELGNQNDVTINGDFDADSLWEVVESFSDFLNNLDQSSPGIAGEQSSVKRVVSTGTHDFRIAKRLEELELTLKRVDFRTEVGKEENVLKSENEELRKENK